MNISFSHLTSTQFNSTQLNYSFSVMLSSMAASFNITTELLDAELSRFIAAGRLNAKIDKVRALFYCDDWMICDLFIYLCLPTAVIASLHCVVL
jgi:hypothetical protein